MTIKEGSLLLRMSLREPEAPSDAILDDVLVRAKSGDAQAFAALLERHEARVLRCALRLLRHREDARDAAQEVFIRLYRFLHTFDARRPVEPWLYQMTLNVCRDMARHRAKWATAVSSLQTDSAATANTAAAESDLDSAKGVLAEGLGTLSDREREAVTLRDIEGLTTKDTARLMGVTAFTVRSLISRARVKLRRFRDRKLEHEQEL